MFELKDIIYLNFVIILVNFYFTVADALLWRDKKQTVIMLLVLAAIYFNFIASGHTIITAVSRLLLAAVVFLFINGRLPDKLYASLPLPMYLSHICSFYGCACVF